MDMNQLYGETTLLDRARRSMQNTDGSMWTWLSSDEAALPRNGFPGPFQEKPIKIDCWKYETHEGLTLSDVEYIESSAIESWVEMDHPIGAPKLPTATLRLIHMTRTVYDNLLLHGTMDSISQSLDLPPVHHRKATSIAGGYGVFHSRGKDPVFVMMNNNHASAGISVVVRYDPKTNTSVGYSISTPGTPVHQALLRIPSQFERYSHPFLIPILAVEITLGTIIVRDLGRHSTLLNDIEMKTAFNNYHDKDTPKVEGRDYHHILKRLGDVTTAHIYSRAALQNAKSCNTFLLEQLDNLASWLHDARLTELSDSTAALRERAKYNASNIANAEVYMGTEKRLELQRSVLFNLMALADNSKKDGSTVKLLAVLGTIYFSLRHLSTFSAMPLFNWNAKTASDIINGYFGVSWAISLLFTVLGAGLGSWWFLIRGRERTPRR